MPVRHWPNYFSPSIPYLYNVKIESITSPPLSQQTNFTHVHHDKNDWNRDINLDGHGGFSIGYNLIHHTHIFVVTENC